MTVNGLLDQNVRENPDKPYVFFRDRVISYGDIDQFSNQLANTLLSLGVKKEDRVAIFLPNSLEFLYTMFGCFKIGAVIVPLNTALSAEEVKYILNHSESSVLVVHEQFMRIVNTVRPNLEWAREIIVVSDESPNEGFLLFSQLMPEAAPQRPDVGVSGENNISIIYTSGTTGKPKGVVHTHNTYVNAARAWNESIGIIADDRPLSVLPLFHINAQLYFAIGAMDLQTGFVLEERFSSSGFWQKAIETESTVSCLPGNALVMLDNMPASEVDKAHQIRIMISAYTPADLYRKFEERFGLDIIEGYTLTESPSALFNRPGNTRVGSIGKPMSGVIPVPDRVRNEEIKAFIVLNPGERLDPGSIIIYCRERLAEFKVPRYIDFIDALPKTAKLSIKKHELKNLSKDQVTGSFDRLKA